MIYKDEVGKMVDGIKSLATPLQDLILREAMTDREYANKAAVELLALRADNTEKNARLREWLESYDITMPCGHKNRYLMTNGRGDLVIDDKGNCQCVMCDLADAKARAKAAEENWHKNEARIAKLLESIKAAQMELHATQRNWDEECLFECNDILTAALKGVA